MAKKWVDKIIDISRVRDRMIVIKVLVQRIVASLISADHCQKDDFYDSLINVVRKLGEKKLKGLLSFVLL